MKKDDTAQQDLFEVPTYDFSHMFFPENVKKQIFLVGCGRSKRRKLCVAKDLYTSQRFKTSIELAENLGNEYLIISGKHGVIEPGKVLEPYDQDVGKLDKKEKSEWATRILADLSKYNKNAQYIILSGDDYSNVLLEKNASRKIPISLNAPFKEIQIENHKIWLEQALHFSFRVRDMRFLYDLIDRNRCDGKIFKLKDLKSQDLPIRGVYVFIDPSEKSLFGSSRIVRIGTHAVSYGSKASIRNRLKNHLGNLDGIGNHRGSIFRLHVGKALLNSNPEGAGLSSWGVGQSSSREIVKEEAKHERKVTAYLENLEVFVIPIEDEPSKNSLRAIVETQLIALFTEKFSIIDKPSKKWLGINSSEETIVKCGLWNLRDVGKVYCPNSPGSVTGLMSLF